MEYRIIINDRNYYDWIFTDFHTKKILNVDENEELKCINPIDDKLFTQDVFKIVENRASVIYSSIKSAGTLAGVLMLENNKTFGRTENKKRLLYKCVPDNTQLPAFLIPYDVKIGFSKVQKNKYVAFRFDYWTGKHPHGILMETIGDVDNLDAFYEYQLYCRNLHASLTQFTNSTKQSLRQKTNDEYIETILNNPDFNVSDYRHKTVFTIDPTNSTDFDDGFSIEKMEGGEYRVSVYIANVFLWLETLGLWSSFSHRVSTIYLPDRRRPMLPTILSDTLCSLQEKEPRFALTMEIIVDSNGKINTSKSFVYKNVLISVTKNYIYEEKGLLSNPEYCKLFEISKKMDIKVRDSHDTVAHWMVFMNSHAGVDMASKEVGIYRSVQYINSNLSSFDKSMKDDTQRVIHGWNNLIGQYVLFSENVDTRHDLMNINTYIQITSPIRRLVDLINQILLCWRFGLVQKLSDDVVQFLNHWTSSSQLAYLNITMRSIRKVQTDCDVLARCSQYPHILEKEHIGVVFDKCIKQDGLIHYMVYLEDLKLVSRIKTQTDVLDYSRNLFRLYLFEDEDKVKKKIRLQFRDVI